MTLRSSTDLTHFRFSSFLRISLSHYFLLSHSCFLHVKNNQKLWRNSCKTISYFLSSYLQYNLPNFLVWRICLVVLLFSHEKYVKPYIFLYHIPLAIFVTISKTHELRQNNVEKSCVHDWVLTWSSTRHKMFVLFVPDRFLVPSLLHCFIL